jgi:tetratricopeptide (TPR) repeat protein
LQIDPAQRYQSSQELARDLDHYLGREPVSVFAESIWTRIARKARKHPTLTGGLIAGIAALSTAGLIGSAIVGSKNQQLSSSNEQLAVALTTSQDANVIAMTSLRSMVNEAVSHRMAQRESLSDGDRAYIESILQQYLALAGVQGDTEHALAIRAEAEGQVGALYYQLNQPVDAAKHLEFARTLYQQLRQLRQTDADAIALIGYLEVLAAIQFEEGQFEKSHQTADEAIDLLTRMQALAGGRPSEQPATEGSSVNENAVGSISTLADLTMLRAKSGEALGASEDSLSDFRVAAALMEKAMESRPDDAAMMFAAGSNLRTYASHLNERATSIEQRREALKVADKAVELLDAATKRHPDLHRYQSSLAWAHYDRSFIHESLENPKDAIQDMWYAGSITEKLTDRFPLLHTYRDRVPAMIARRCQLYLNTGEVVFAYTDARNFSDLELTADQCSLGIDLLLRALDADTDDVLDRVDAICHIAHLHARRGRALREAGEPERGLEEFNKACQKMEDLKDESKLTTYTSFSFLWSLERIEVLLLLNKYDEAHERFDEAVVRRQAVRNFYDDAQLQAIDAQLETFHTQLKAAK